MSDLRRRYLMVHQAGGQQYDADSYIQNGLVFQLDGLEKGSSSTKWTDRKGGIGFPYIAATSEVQTDSVHFTGSGYLTGDALITPSFTYDSMTIEVACTYDTHSSITHVVLVCNVAPNFAFGWYNPTTLRCSSGLSKPAWSTSDMTVLKTYSITSDHSLANINVSLTARNNSSFSNNSGVIELGGRSYNSTNGYIGDVYAIRIYNRQLTLAEMAFNQAIDNERFNLGITV